jgi:2-polyprenyl-6-methoxyphenol hydroxylase-like FAD-dependent oxidoreductase
MVERVQASVAVIGGGPVGLSLALDLAWRGIEVVVAEQRAAGEPPSVKCNHVSARSMEFFRRLGLAAEIRRAGLPDDYPNDVVFRTRATGHELTRIPIPCRRERFSSRTGPDTGWPTPEPAHRINQIFFEPILFRHAAQNPRIRMLSRTRIESLEQGPTSVRAHGRALETDTPVELEAAYLIGCDGGRSLVRRQIGAHLEGDEIIQRVQSTYIRAPALLARITPPPAWMSYIYNPERCGNLVAIDGRELWLIHNYLLPHEHDFAAVDRDRAIRAILGVGGELEYQILSREDWVGRRLVADTFRDRRVFICGDAAHLWVPYAGYGMNAGIADAMNLSWLLAAQLKAWAPAAILDAHERERHPITEQVSRFAMRHAHGAIRERTQLPAALENPGAVGEAARKAVGEAAYSLHVQQFGCAGLNFGYFYDDSPLIVYDEEPAPAYSMRDYTPSSAPGCRAPHFWLEEGRSLYDALGADYTLLRFDARAVVDPLLHAARRARLPLTVLEAHTLEIPAGYRHRLLIVRPDQHVAWRGDALPADLDGLVDRLRGAAATHTSNLKPESLHENQTLSVPR